MVSPNFHQGVESRGQYPNWDLPGTKMGDDNIWHFRVWKNTGLVRQGAMLQVSWVMGEWESQPTRQRWSGVANYYPRALC